jgi:hypothetical protein
VSAQHDDPDRFARIGAYLDGELSPADRQTFEAEMAADAALADDVARYRRNDASMRAALGAEGPESIDNELLAKLGLGNAEVVSLDAARRERSARTDVRFASKSVARRWPWPAAGALAASLAVFLVFGNPQSPAPATDEEASPAFQVAMRDLPSASTASLRQGVTISPRLTFVARDGRYCREFAITGAGETQAGIACRTGSAWRVEALTKGDVVTPNEGELRTAGGEGNAALDATYRRLAASDPLDLASEKRLISDSWKQSTKNAPAAE